MAELKETQLKEAQNQIKDALLKLKEERENALVETVKEAVKAFNDLPEEVKIKEMGQARTAVSCINSITECIKDIPAEKLKEIAKAYPEIKPVFLHSLAYLELGLKFGYTSKKEEK